MNEESLADLEEAAATVYYYQSELDVIANTFKSIMPSNVFDTFVGFFAEPTTGFYPQYEVEKTPVQEIIDVSEEMNEETLKQIADKALMAKLQEVEQTQESVSIEKESVSGKKSESDDKTEKVESESG
ncbi:hypothetical protein Hanom_Chr10g00930651 [Helianthus anomalus]